MSRLKADTQLTLLSRIPVMILSFLAVVLLTRLLGPEGNGVYTFTMAVLNLFFTVVGFQLDGSIPFFLAKYKDDQSKIFSAVGILALLSILLFVVILTLLVFVLPIVRNWVLPEGQPVLFFFLFLVISFSIRRISTLLLSSLRGLFRFKAFNLYMILHQLIPVVVYGFLLVLSIQSEIGISLLTCFTVILCMEGVLMLIGWILVWQSHGVSFSKNYKPFVEPILSYSSKSLMQSAGHFLNKRLDVWFVQVYRGTTSLGHYGLATQVANFMSEAMTPFTQVLTPYVAGAPDDQHRPMVERTARLNLTIAIIAAAGIIATSWFFIPFFFGNAFKPAIAATQILALGIIFISQRLVFTGYFKAINKQRYAVQATWSGVIITLILDIILIPRYGIVGASWATVFAYATTTFYLVLQAQKILGFSWTRILFIQQSDITWLFTKRQDDQKNEVKET